MTPPAVHNGYYTISSPSGQHRTLRVHTVQDGALQGRRVLSLLTGPDNTADYTGFGFLQPDGSVRLWRRADTDGYRRLAKCFTSLATRGDASTYAVHGGFRLQVSRRCLRCNRELTDPVSIELGIGPVCRAGGTD